MRTENFLCEMSQILLKKFPKISKYNINQHINNIIRQMCSKSDIITQEEFFGIDANIRLFERFSLIENLCGTYSEIFRIFQEG